MAATAYRINGRVRLGSMAGAAGVSLVGMLVMVLAGLFSWGQPALAVGAVIAAIGVGLVVLAQEAARRAGVVAMLDDDGFVISGNGTRAGLPWSQVRTVTMAGNALIVRDAKGKELKVVAPPGARPDELDALAAAMASALDADRGYRHSL